ncbi:DUF4232 domain-containing protein [Spirillospora sp. NPDC048819]|uniref:DUF4232 domain-containing protein n=1 Tax=Spirillospora sp. NPDC048819 TaxID=3155268 RepID=UPI0033E04925
MSRTRLPRIIWGTSAAAAAAIALAGCGSTTDAGAAASEVRSSATPTSTATAGTPGSGTGSGTGSPGEGSPSTGSPGTGTGDGSGTGTGDGSGTGTGDGSGTGTGDGSGTGTPAGTPTGGAPGDGRGGDGGGDYPLCTSDTLSAYLTNRSFVETNRYVTLVLTNTSRTTCNLRGFASLQLLNAGGLVETRVEHHGTPQTVTLGGHDSAYERLHWTSEHAGDEGNPCQPTATTLRVYTLYQTRPHTVSWNHGPVCNHGRIWLTPITLNTAGY